MRARRAARESAASAVGGISSAQRRPGIFVLSMSRRREVRLYLFPSVAHSMFAYNDSRIALSNVNLVSARAHLATGTVSSLVANRAVGAREQTQFLCVLAT